MDTVSLLQTDRQTYRQSDRQTDRQKKNLHKKLAGVGGEWRGPMVQD